MKSLLFLLLLILLHSFRNDDESHITVWRNKKKCSKIIPIIIIIITIRQPDKQNIRFYDDEFHSKEVLG